MTTTARGRVDPPGAAERRRDTGPTARPAAPRLGRARGIRRVRPPQRRRPGLSLLGIPVATLVAVELIALCALLVAEKKLVVAAIAIASA